MTNGEKEGMIENEVKKMRSMRQDNVPPKMDDALMDDALMDVVYKTLKETNQKPPPEKEKSATSKPRPLTPSTSPRISKPTQHK